MSSNRRCLQPRMNPDIEIVEEDIFKGGRISNGAAGSAKMGRSSADGRYFTRPSLASPQRSKSPRFSCQVDCAKLASFRYCNCSCSGGLPWIWLPFYVECSTEECYRKTCIRIAGIESYDLHALDGLWNELRTEKGRYLQNSDIESIFSDVTHYGYYWKAPVGVKLEAAKISLCEADRGTTDQAVKLWRHNLVQSLFVKLKSMEVRPWF